MPVRPRRMSLVPSCVGPLPAGSRRRVFLGKRPRLVSASPGPPTLSWGLGAETAESPRTPAGNSDFLLALHRAQLCQESDPIPREPASGKDPTHVVGSVVRRAAQRFAQRNLTPIIFPVRQIIVQLCLVRAEATSNVNFAGRSLALITSNAAPVSDSLRMRQAIASPLNSMLPAFKIAPFLHFLMSCTGPPARGVRTEADLLRPVRHHLFDIASELPEVDGQALRPQRCSKKPKSGPSNWLRATP